MTKSTPLVLGSTSPFRKELLERLNIPFICHSPEVDETPLSGETPEALAVRLAEAKARAVAAQFPDAVVIGADQVLDLNGKALGKAGTPEKAVQQLLSMSEQKLVFHSALCTITPDGTVQKDNVKTMITMRPISPAAAKAYIDIDKAWNCAGSAKMERLGIALVQKYESDDPTAIIGLPLISLTNMLINAGLEILPQLGGCAK